MIKFPSINQFRNVVQHVKQQAQFKGLDADGIAIMDRAAIAPTLSYVGTVKLHGTNAAIVFKPDYTIQFQSRERVIVPGDDNANFAGHFSAHIAELQELRENLFDLGLLRDDATVAVYGEWCGGNIQSNVAISGLPKMFVVFAVKTIDAEGNEAWRANLVRHCQDASISLTNSEQFTTWYLTINFDSPEQIQNTLGELTMAVEASCPVGSALGQEGVGEGIVWRCVEHPSSDYWFKVKGEKHSASKVKTLAAVDVEAIESLNAFVASVVTENRLEQGLQNLLNEQQKPFAMTSMGDFIRWVHGDVIKEENDTIQANGFEPKKLGGPIALIARRWFVQKLDEHVLATN